MVSFHKHLLARLAHVNSGFDRTPEVGVQMQSVNCSFTSKLHLHALEKIILQLGLVKWRTSHPVSVKRLHAKLHVGLPLQASRTMLMLRSGLPSAVKTIR